MNTQSFDAVCRSALERLAAGDEFGAFDTLIPLLEYPGKVETREAFQTALQALAEVGLKLFGKAFAEKVRNGADNSDDPEALYTLGYELIEQELSGFAATVLARVHKMAPDDERILTELATALEMNAYHAEACRVLRERTAALHDSFMCRYLLAFNALMLPDVDEPRALLPGLLADANGDEAQQFMVNRIEGMLARFDAISQLASLDRTDLRGWHLVRTGGLLLKLAQSQEPAGLEDGRYGKTTDSYERCLAGIHRVEWVLGLCDIPVPRVLLLPDQDSLILGYAAATVLKCEAVPWSKDDSEPGLIVAYDLEKVCAQIQSCLREHRSGQLLWSHASRWTIEHRLTADITIYFHQANTPPWRPGKSTVGITEEGSRSLGEHIAKAAAAPEAIDDLQRVVDLAFASKGCGAHAAGIWRNAGNREKQWAVPLRVSTSNSADI